MTECAARLGCTRPALSRPLNDKARISPAMAIALERLGWSNAAYWMRRQAAYDLARERSPAGGLSAVTADDFRDELARLFEAAANVGRAQMVVRAGDLHRAVGGYPGTNHRKPMCSNVMYAGMVEGDEVLSAPPSGQSASVAIAYRLPRPGRGERANAD